MSDKKSDKETKDVYVVLETFADKDGTVYEKDDVYKGNRINALSTRRNKYKRPFIAKVETKKESPKTNKKEGD